MISSPHRNDCPAIKIKFFEDAILICSSLSENFKIDGEHIYLNPDDLFKLALEKKNYYLKTFKQQRPLFFEGVETPITCGIKFAKDVEYTISGTIFDPKFVNSSKICYIVGDFGEVFQGNYDYMFYKCFIGKIEETHAGNGDDSKSAIIKLNTNSVKFMFYQADSLDWGFVSKFDVSNVNYMNSMFYNAFSFNPPLNDWNVENVKDMRGMFCGTVFNQPLDKWNTKNVKNMGRMFEGAIFFNQSLNEWNVENVEDMHCMFYGASSFDQPLNRWNVKNVQNMRQMFVRASSFKQSLNDWNIKNVKDADKIVSGVPSYNRSLGIFNIEKSDNQ